MKRLIFIFFYCLHSIPLFSTTVGERLSKIPETDQKNMSHFFDFAIKLDNVAHVLYFDNKPVSITSFSLTDEFFKEIVQGWLAFKKHEKHFKHPNFILCEKVVSFPDFYALHLYIINKRAIKKSFEEHNSLFKKILGNSFSPENYLEKLENGHDLSSLLQENDLLLGILLGYGKNSSKAFYERNKKHPGEIEWTKDYRPISGQKQPDVEIYPISFMGDPDSNESRSIIAAYDNELETIWKKYLEKNKDSSLFFLEAFCK